MTGPSLSEKRKQWIEALSGPDSHSVVNQLTAMTWDAAAFRIANEARRLALPAPDGGVQVCWLLHSLLDRGFFTLHMVAVRRLMDTYPLEGEKGVYSLAGLLEDMQRHHHLLSRQAIFEAEGLVYDYEPIRQAYLDDARARLEAGQASYWVPQDLDWQRHEQRHQEIDELTGACRDRRQPGDTVPAAVFDNLLSKAEAASTKIVEYTTKFVAHAASPESRAVVQADDAGPTLACLWAAQTQLCQVAAFVCSCILGLPCPGFLAIPQFDQFEHIDKPLVAPSQMAHLRRLWDDYEKDCLGWSQWGLADYEKEFS